MPKFAWIDHAPAQAGMFGMLLQKRGIEYDFAETLEDFMVAHDLATFDALLFHPGLERSYQILGVQQKFPQVRLALISNAATDYVNPGKVPAFGYNPEIAEAFFLRKALFQ